MLLHSEQATSLLYNGVQRHKSTSIIDRAHFNHFYAHRIRNNISLPLSPLSK